MNINFEQFDGFEWDSGNRDKNNDKHNVSNFECKEVFFNKPLIILDDDKRSLVEKRYALFGKTDTSRKLVIIYTRRESKIRIISARDMDKNEKEFYNNHEKI